MEKLARLIILLTIGACIISNVNAQEVSGKLSKTKADAFSNTIQIKIGNYYIRNTEHSSSPFAQIGISYERKIHKSFYLGAEYIEWNSLWKGSNAPTNTKLILYEEGSPAVSQAYKPIINGLEERHGYKMIDLYAFYRYQFGSSAHFLKVGGGASYNWGYNSYLAKYIQGTPFDAIAVYEQTKVDYLGLISIIAYDYLLLKNRVNIGMDYMPRYYPDRVKIQHDISLHIGICF